jgi:uncharacterized protein (TIGR00730 family)
MNDPTVPPKRIFPSSKIEAETARHIPSVPQTESPAYRLAFQDTDFLLRPDLRPVRFQLELLKPELFLDEAKIGSTFVFYGSARIPDPELADALVAGASDEEQERIAERLKAKAPYYEVARELARLASSCDCDADGQMHFVVCSGGGPSIMEAAVLPHEQTPNRYVTPDLSFQFHYFALRKMHFLLRARAVAVFPGGYGTFDELFETLTLIQTGKVRPLPVLLFGRDYWNRVVNFDAMVEEGVIAPHDLDIIHWCEDAAEAWDFVQRFYEENPAPAPRQTAPPE